MLLVILALLVVCVVSLVLMVWAECEACGYRIHTIECSERRSLRDALRTKSYDSAVG